MVDYGVGCVFVDDDYLFLIVVVVLLDVMVDVI